MKCMHCQAEKPEGSKYCRKSGQYLRTELVRTKCGHYNLPDSTYYKNCGNTLITQVPTPIKPKVSKSTYFVGGCNQVKKLLGKGGQKKVYLARDMVLDRDITFVLIKTDKLDETTRIRTKREAQEMGKLGGYPNIVSIFDTGEHEGQPYIVIFFMAVGDIEELIDKAFDAEGLISKVVI
jgi:serine/threonine protein kinase